MTKQNWKDHGLSALFGSAVLAVGTLVASSIGVTSAMFLDAVDVATFGQLAVKATAIGAPSAWAAYAMASDGLGNISKPSAFGGALLSAPLMTLPLPF